MIAFDVFVNRKKVARAGVGSDGVLTAMATWVRRQALEEKNKRRKVRWDQDLSFSLGGFRRVNGFGEQLKWKDQKLKPGDVVTIKVITALSVDEPVGRIREDPMVVERSQNRYYRRLKRKFEKAERKRTSSR